MKKVFLVLGMLMVTVISLGQEWKTIEIEDEFGDKTGETRLYTMVEDGKFSNSATTNSGLTVMITDDGDAISFSLYEYNRSPGASLTYELAKGKILVKRADGTKAYYNIKAYKSGGLTLFEKYDKHDFDMLSDLLRNTNGEEISFYIRESDFSDYGSSTYKFTIKTQSYE